MSKHNSKLILYLITLMGIGVGAAAWLSWTHNTARSTTVYSPKGYGGVTPRPKQQRQIAAPDTTAPASAAETVRVAEASYQAGRYAEANRQAGQAVKSYRQAGDLAKRREAAKALRIIAYSAARQGDFRVAREQFLQLQNLASELPDHGAIPVTMGQQEPTLEEEGAFQQAVCTGKIEGDQAAEAQYRYFLTRYPDSLLIHAAVKRIGRLHGGDIPKDAEALWKQAMQTQKEHDKARRREESLCGPECLAELLKRAGKPADVHKIADEMNTSDEGTSLKQWASAARNRGIPAKGVALTTRGLQQQTLPILALIQPGHFVLIDQVTADKVTVWNPDGTGPGHAASSDYTSAKWKEIWNGTAVLIR